MNIFTVFIKGAALSILLSTTTAHAFDVNSSMELSREVVTTIADVSLNESEAGELVDATVYANNDNRIIKIDGTMMTEIAELLNAKKNGWEVKLFLELLRDKEVGSVFKVTAIEILSRENRLSTGLLRSSTTPFEPIVAASKRELNTLFKAAYPYDSEFYDVNDDCFNRAQFWSRTHQHLQSEKGLERGTDKVFIFFSEAYTTKFKHKWWYHVAPVVYLKDKETPYVFDSTFVSSALSLEEWLATFDGHTEGKCLKINNLEDYNRNANKAICMYIVAPMFNYVPTDLYKASRLNNWRCSDFRRVMGFAAPGSRTTNPSARWTDPEFKYLMPKGCQ